MKYNSYQMKFVFIFLFLLHIVTSTVLVVSGGELTLNGAITSNYIDLYINYTAYVKWVAIIWSQNQADTDVTLYKANPSDPANPVTIVDCYLDQNSAIQVDSIPNYQSSVSGFTGSVANGISAAFKRDLVTGDTKDAIIYPDSVTQICVISSTLDFVGGGHETGHQKDCSYISLHKNVDYWQDRLLGNYAGTKSFGGGNVTVYATESTDGFTFESWLFLTVVYKKEGLSPFVPRYIGIFYNDSTANSDMAIIQYNTVGVKLDVHIDDFYAVSSSSADYDTQYTTLQGSNDLSTVMTAYDSSSYMVGSYKRKYETGDTNRDDILVNGASTYCVIYGNSLAFSSYGYSDRFCFNFTLSTQYSSYFRQTSSTSVPVQSYVAPSSSVTVVSAAFEPYMAGAMLLVLMIAV